MRTLGCNRAHPRLQPCAPQARLHWILCHLIANAYAGCGGAADAGVHVDMSLDAALDTVVIEVVNTGGAQLHAQATRSTSHDHAPPTEHT